VRTEEGIHLFTGSPEQQGTGWDSVMVVLKHSQVTTRVR
jgi:hypothetical protein